MPPVAIAAAAVATAAVATGYSIYSGQKAAKQNAKAVEFQRKQASLSDARQKRDTIRAARVAYAQSQVAAENQNVSTSSSASGGQGSIVSQMSDNLSFLDQSGFYTDQTQRYLGKANASSARAQAASDISGFAMTVASNAPSISSAAQKVFKK